MRESMYDSMFDCVYGPVRIYNEHKPVPGKAVEGGKGRLYDYTIRNNVCCPECGSIFYSNNSFNLVCPCCGSPVSYYGFWKCELVQEFKKVRYFRDALTAAENEQMNYKLVQKFFLDYLPESHSNHVRRLAGLQDWNSSKHFAYLASQTFNADNSQPRVQYKYQELAADLQPENYERAYRALQTQLNLAKSYFIQYDMTQSKYLPVCLSERYGGPEYREELLEKIQKRRDAADAAYKAVVADLRKKRSRTEMLQWVDDVPEAKKQVKLAQAEHTRLEQEYKNTGALHYFKRNKLFQEMSHAEFEYKQRIDALCRAEQKLVGNKYRSYACVQWGKFLKTGFSTPSVELMDLFWMIEYVDDSRALLILRDPIQLDPYFTGEDLKTGWDNNSIRKWLNTVFLRHLSSQNTPFLNAHTVSSGADTAAQGIPDLIFLPDEDIARTYDVTDTRIYGEHSHLIRAKDGSFKYAKVRNGQAVFCDYEEGNCIFIRPAFYLDLTLQSLYDQPFVWDESSFVPYEKMPASAGVDSEARNYWPNLYRQVANDLLGYFECISEFLPGGDKSHYYIGVLKNKDKVDENTCRDNILWYLAQDYMDDKQYALAYRCYVEIADTDVHKHDKESAEWFQTVYKNIIELLEKHFEEIKNAFGCSDPNKLMIAQNRALYKWCNILLNDEFSDPEWKAHYAKMAFLAKGEIIKYACSDLPAREPVFWEYEKDWVEAEEMNNVLDNYGWSDGDIAELNHAVFYMNQFSDIYPSHFTEIKKKSLFGLFK